MSTVTPKPLTRARSVAGLQERLAAFFTEDGYARGLAFQPRPSDVLIATYPKCGTTWMQQIVHGLRTRGDMTFREITEAVPWLEAAFDMAIDPDLEQAANPRCYKTHLSWHQIPKGGRYIHVGRDPKDALVSAYRFFEGWFFEPGAFDADTYARQSFLEGRRGEDYWSFLLSWWQRRDDPDVLFLFFEDMKRDLEQSIEQVAEFMALGLDDELRQIVLTTSSMAFMKAHEHQFDDHLIRQARDAVCGLPPDSTSTKVNKGRVGDGDALSPDVLEALDARWQETVGAATGARSYEELRERSREERDRA
jgi:hypothetical protein